jgi:FMN phosphatase YigB (HAD superfamily)
VSKPSSAFFERIVAAAERPAAEIAYVGDRVDNDVEPALQAGMVAVHIRRGPWGYLQQGREQAHVCIDSLDELPRALNGV